MATSRLASLVGAGGASFVVQCCEVDPSVSPLCSCPLASPLLAARRVSHSQATSRTSPPQCITTGKVEHSRASTRRRAVRRPVVTCAVPGTSPPPYVESPPFTEDALDRAAALAQATLREMLSYLEDLGNTGGLEELTVQLAANAAISKRIDKLDGAFMLAIDTMLMQAERNNDPQSVAILLIVKQEVLAALAKSFPPNVQVLELLTRVPLKEVRKDLICLAAAGGGQYTGGEYETREDKLLVPAARIENVLRQTDDMVYDMEERAQVADRRLLARLVLIREELRAMMAGGIHDPRANTRVLGNLPQKEVEFLSALAAMRPGEQMSARIAKVLAGQDEGADKVTKFVPQAERAAAEYDIDEVRTRGLDDEELAEEDHALRMRIAGESGETRDGQVTTTLPVRPGQLLETLTKLTGSALSGYTAGGDAGLLMQMRHVRKVCLEELEDLAGWGKFEDASEYRP
ncbi:hypothetical protein KFL_002700140 [Klebsormidium nitens]|uniref:Uncharacterized protein n=1 Tax=Klebsormidium nitens TaxID=105231 RepID=A0A1Y1I567_KLENI|nr:hypothetical protein KFL_002700140 [Klebsormidium nitens]|eukprot:GAQ86095.1 hypothetical protein KFL_002700140 [Klebsormidium nitens]